MIHYIKGDATYPQGDDNKVIVHCVNNIGAWGAGFVLALNKRWPEVKAKYKRWAETHRATVAGSTTTGPLVLGEVQFVEVCPTTWVANLVGQSGIGGDTPPIRYEAIRDGLRKVAAFVKASGASVHMPKMGSGLAGGDWNRIEKIIKETLVGIEVTVYEFQDKEARP